MRTSIRQAILIFALVGAVSVPAFAVKASATVTHAATLREGMRKLWTDHVVWTREYVVAAVDGSPAANAAANRERRPSTR